MERILMTGMGGITPLGLDMASTWDAMLNGRSGVATIGAFDPTAFPVRIAAEVEGFEGESVASRKDARRMDRSVLFALAAARQAVADAGLDGLHPVRTAIIVGAAIGGIALVEEQQQVLATKGPGRVSPTWLPNSLVDAATSYIATAYDVIGPNFAVISACASGSHAIGVAADLIRQGRADVALAGGTEACLTPLVLATFCQMQVLADRNDDPPAASRPFDRARSGFVIGEGATVVVLESEAHARARGASVYAEVVGYGASNDAYHVATPHPEGRGLIRMLEDALETSHVRPDEVGYINPHGTGTPLGDPAETSAIKTVFGAHAYELAVSSTKSMTGHLFAAAGAMETAASALALRDQVVPPTINLDDPDPACDLDYVPHKAREVDIDVAVSSSIGLGGHNGAVVLRRWQPAG